VSDDVPVTRLDEVRWRRSRFSNPDGDGLEVAALPSGEVAVRNSRDPGAPVLIYTPAEMAAFISGARDGEFDDLIA
jgi:hypothetical protein